MLIFENEERHGITLPHQNSMQQDHFTSGNFKKEDFIAAIDKDGYAIVKGVISEGLCNKLVPELEAAIAKEAAFHGTTAYKDYGTLLACPIYGGSFIELAGHGVLMQPFNWLLDDTCIIYVYTSSSMPPGLSNYTGRIHVDRPHFIPGYTEALGCLVLLNDFTEENGATYVLPGSHNNAARPVEEYFYKHAERITAPRGSVFYFNLRLWHAGGHNATDQWRHCLGIGMVRGYMKQRIDLPRAMAGVDLTGVSDAALQKLGFFAQPPSSLAEFYLPLEQRKYSQRSEWDKEGK